MPEYEVTVSVTFTDTVYIEAEDRDEVQFMDVEELDVCVVNLATAEVDVLNVEERIVSPALRAARTRLANAARNEGL
jgi:hypothetical protein